MNITRLVFKYVAVLVTTVYSVATLGTEPSELIVDIQMSQKMTQEIQSVLLKDIEVLTSLNAEEFHELDLKQIKSDIPKLVVAINLGPPLVGSGYRNGGVNFTEQNTFILNYEKLAEYSRSQKIFLTWHETLGALGYNDDNYLISIALLQKIANPQTEFHSEVKKRIRAQLNEAKRTQNLRFQSRNGGATGVGGGGDGDIAEIKSELFNILNYLALNNQITPSVLVTAFDTAIESIEFQNRYSFTVPMLRTKIARNDFSGKFSILVNTKEWDSNDNLNGRLSQRNMDLINEIIDILEARKK